MCAHTRPIPTHTHTPAVSYNKAIDHLRYAKARLQASGAPFFVVAGIRRPHLNWRAPAGYLKLSDKGDLRDALVVVLVLVCLC